MLLQLTAILLLALAALAFVAYRRDAEQAKLDRLSGDARSTCAAAIDACLDGATCDDFRACHADIDRSVCPCPDPSRSSSCCSIRSSRRTASAAPT